MSTAGWIALPIVGGLGALARFAVDGVIVRRVGDAFWVGILTINVSGAFALGVVAGSGAGDTVLKLAGTGALGAYTTFSTWMLQARRLGEERRRTAFVLNLSVTFALGLLAVWAGRALGRVLA